MRSPLSLATLLLAVVPLSQAQVVRDPHASILNAEQRQAFLAKSNAPLIVGAIHSLGSCTGSPVVPAPAAPIEIPHHYMVGSNGPTNPAEREATQVYTRFEDRVTRGMNRWLASGDEAQAQCALAQLDTWAQGKALLDYDVKEWSQSEFQVEWTLSAIGIADSVLVQDTKLDPEVQARVNAWLNASAHRLMTFDKAHGNNHHYWRGLAFISVGVTTKDDALFLRGISAYKDAIDEIDSRGALPQEMARHENAIHYQGFAIQPLILIAEFAARQGVNAYGYTANGHTLKDAIVFFGQAVSDPALVKPYTSDSQKTPSSADDFAPFVFYISRFGAKDLPPSILAGIKPNSAETRLGGNTIILAAR